MSVRGLLRRGAAFVHGGPVTAEELSRVHETVVFAQPSLKGRLFRFWVLLLLASAIATAGLLADSVATVIGAMIVAPLMLPIMGLAYGISIGSGKAILASLAVGIGGILTTVAVGYGVGSLMTSSTFDPEQVGQIMSRTSPNLLDLFAALATGMAGAFAVGRKDISDTLPGVAIAISLVPPLANAGLLFSAGRLDLAWGSVLLFVTNYLAIVLTGAIVFGLMGYPRASMGHRSSHGKRLALALVIVMFLIVSLPLAVQSLLAYVRDASVANVRAITEEWLGDSDYSVVSAEFDDAQATVDIVIRGSGQLPPESTLAQSLEGEVFDLDVILEVVPVDRRRITTATTLAQ